MSVRSDPPSNSPWNLQVSEGYVFVVAPPLSPAFLPAGFANPLEAPSLRPGVILPDIGLIMVRFILFYEDPLTLVS
jgi:hypothetical protein